MANTITGNGRLSVGAYISSQCGIVNGAPGRIRLEAFQQQFTGPFEGDFRSASPFNTFAPTTSSSAVSVVSVAGIAVNQNPTGTFQMPDVTINNATAVPVVIQANNIPVGTVIQLQIYSENGASSTINFPALPSAGKNVKVTANATFPIGYSRGFVQASFTVR